LAPLIVKNATSDDETNKVLCIDRYSHSPQYKL
jgi:hypothetical protein